MKNILFRCDSSSNIGLGHTKRCLVLAQRLKNKNKNLKIGFATQDLHGNINAEIEKANFVVHHLSSNDLEELDFVLESLKINFLIIDSYEIDYFFEKQIKIKHPTIKILSFDDTLNPHCADIVLNHGIQAQEQDYKNLLDKKTKLLCGSEYTLLRDEFLDAKKIKVIKNIIAIILGGNDVLNLSSKISNLLLEINKKYKITIITTSANQHLQEFKKNKHIEVLVDINNIATVLLSKGFVITASGGSLFEVLSLKKKFINITVASNQKVVDTFFKNKGIKTTIDAENLTRKSLKNRIKYIKKNNVYKKLTLKFAKNRLVRKILKELK